MLRRNTKLLALVLVLVILMSMIALAVYEPFKVNLNMLERIVVLSLFPEKGSWLTLKIVREMQMELAASEEEAKLGGMKDLDDGGVKAENWFVIPEKEIVFGDIALKIVTDELKRLNEEEDLTQNYFSVYEKFIIIPNKEGD